MTTQKVPVTQNDEVSSRIRRSPAVRTTDVKGVERNEAPAVEHRG